MNRILVSIVLVALFSSSVSAEGAATKKELKIGLLPFVSATRLIKLFLPLKSHLEENGGYQVTFVSAPNFRKFLTRTHEQAYDFVFTAPHFALLAEREFGYQRLARFSRQLKACIFVRQNSPINKLNDLKGSVVSTPGPLAIVSVLGEVMLNNKNLELPGSVSFLRTPSHNNAIISVVNEDADAGIVSLPVFKFYTSKEENKIKLLECSESIPSPMFLASKSMKASDRNVLALTLLDFPNSQYGKKFFEKTPYKSMKAISDEDMRLLEKYLETLKSRMQMN